MISNYTLTSSWQTKIKQSKTRKSWLLSVTGNEDVQCCEVATNTYFTVPSGGTLSCKIPEDNPKLEIKMKCTSSCTVEIWEHHKIDTEAMEY